VEWEAPLASGLSRPSHLPTGESGGVQGTGKVAVRHRIVRSRRNGEQKMCRCEIEESPVADVGPDLALGNPSTFSSSGRPFARATSNRTGRMGSLGSRSSRGGTLVARGLCLPEGFVFRRFPLLRSTWPAVKPRAGSAAGRVVSDPVSLRDLPATFVDLLGFAQGSPFPGKSLARY